MKSKHIDCLFKNNNSDAMHTLMLLPYSYLLSCFTVQEKLRVVLGCFLVGGLEGLSSCIGFTATVL